jgi:L-threonylcarbamoyladenylate synthase
MQMKKIKTEIIKINCQKPDLIVIKKISQIIKNGGLFVFPTETVYGVGALMSNRLAINKIYQLRKRPKNKALLILVSSFAMALKYIQKTSSQTKNNIEKLWPGPLTIIFKKRKNVPNFVTANQKTVAVRVPENKFLLALIKKIGQPIVAPSANLSGGKSPITAQETFKNFLNKVDLILDGGKTKYQHESTILDLTGRKSKIIREGVIRKKQLSSYL